LNSASAKAASNAGWSPGLIAIYGGGRTFGDDSRTYIRAVVLNEVGPDDDDLVTERPMRARVLHNPLATPRPLGTFSAPADRHPIHDDTVWHVGSTAELGRAHGVLSATGTGDRYADAVGIEAPLAERRGLGDV
jgi:hypothetical protein